MAKKSSSEDDLQIKLPGAYTFISFSKHPLIPILFCSSQEQISFSGIYFKAKSAISEPMPCRAHILSYWIPEQYLKPLINCP